MDAVSKITLFVGGSGVWSEAWRPIAGCEGTYEVSDQGRVRRVETGRILKTFADQHGYRLVRLYLWGESTTRKVFHLVADAFLPKKGPTDTVVRHLNDDPFDNRVCNLARGTRLDNAADAIRNGKSAQGITHGLAKLTEDQVREIRRLYATGNFTQREIALQFGVDQTTISPIVNRQTWKHIA